MSTFKVTNPTQDWFCFDYYIYAGQPKMEAALFEYATKLILYRLVSEASFKEVIKELELRQDALAEQNRRWKRVDLRISSGMNNICWLYVGASHFRLRKVLGDF